MQDLYRFAGKGVLYLAKVDVQRPLYKYGITRNIYKRVLTSHVKTFPTFEIQHVAVAQHRELVERFLTLELQYRQLHHKEEFNGKLQKELILLNSEEHVEEMKELIDRIVAYTNQTYVTNIYHIE